MAKKGEEKTGQDSPYATAESAIIAFIKGAKTGSDEKRLIEKVANAQKAGLTNIEVFRLTQDIEIKPKYNETQSHELPRLMNRVRRLLQA